MFLREESCWGSLVQSGQIHCSCNTALHHWWPNGLSVQKHRHLSSLDIMLTLEGVSMAVTCCAALNFSTILMTFR